MSKDAPVTATATGGPVPIPEIFSQNNAFAQVTIIQLYFFLWKWLAASLLFAIPFIILSLLIQILFKL